ncbi:MAG TPA: hypothetical protein VEN30_00190 [Paraburkholderia sp.]|nr:hypothetical protein [Paraburkholderia sp.]
MTSLKAGEQVRSDVPCAVMTCQQNRRGPLPFGPTSPCHASAGGLFTKAQRRLYTFLFWSPLNICGASVQKAGKIQAIDFPI